MQKLKLLVLFLVLYFEILVYQTLSQFINQDVKHANIDVYSRLPYCMGGMFLNDLPKHSQDINSKTLFKFAIVDLI